MGRYQQQIILPEVGLDGQKKISEASVLIIGAGGLGVVVASYLVAIGFGKIGICDFDDITESNLHRQFSYSPMDIGKKKATVLSQYLRLQNPQVEVKDICSRIDKGNISSIAEDYQLICDCTDMAESRLVVNGYCAEKRKPLVHGAVSDWQGYITVFHHRLKFDLDDLFNPTDYLSSQSCSMAGIMSPVCGIIGSYMANETVKIVLNLENVLEGKLLYVNGLNNSFRTLRLKKT